MSGFQITMRADFGGVVELDIMDAIGKQPDGSGVTPADVQQFIRANRAAPELLVNISSSGGSGFDGLAIYQALREFPGLVRTVGTGIVASAAAIIFLAGAVRELAGNAGLMIHRASARPQGNASDLKRASEVLDQLDASQTDIITSRTGQDRQQVSKWLAAETWFTAAEAMQYGFATKLTGDVPVTLSYDLNGLDVPDFVRSSIGPKRLEDLFRLPEPPASAKAPTCLADLFATA
jgi:ATP-dependent protease ClpP protease subunit